jgi:hypothetical protein
MRDTFADILNRHPPTCIFRGRADDAQVSAGVCVIARESTSNNYVAVEVIEAPSDVTRLAINRLDNRATKGERNLVAILFSVPDRRERSLLCYAIQDVLP